MPSWQIVALILTILQPKKGVQVHTPPFMDGQPQLRQQDVARAKNVAKLRVHVERVIRRVKVFRILANVFPISMSSVLNDIWVVCCYLTNFLPPVWNFLEGKVIRGQYVLPVCLLHFVVKALICLFVWYAAVFF